jgi:NAD-dependent DNA ligase
MEHLIQLKKKGVIAIEKLKEKTLSKMINLAKDAYYNSEPIISDNLYDILENLMKEKYPNNKSVSNIGAPITNVKLKVKLPFEMWSMDKIKPDTNSLHIWKHKFTGPYIVSCKLDGVSGLYDNRNEIPKLYTRGDGKIGQDISHLIPYLNLPTNCKGLVVRGEFIIKRELFEEKYKNIFANPRNMVSGLINKLTYDERTNDIDFISYEFLTILLKPSEQLTIIKKAGFKCVKYNSIDDLNNLTNNNLSSILIEWRKNYEYEIDGLIITDDKLYERKSGNPEHSFAFKMILSEQITEAKVVDVLWEPSKDGYLKPRVQIEPINLCGVKIEYATGFNGKFIEDNKIGIGAIIQIIRSGDVIPHIKAVTVPAINAKMPSHPYIWSEKHVDVLLEDTSTDKTVLLKNITAFFTSIEVTGLAKGNIKRLIETGYDTIPKIIKMEKSDFEKVGFKTLAEKFVDSIKTRLEEASLVELMIASNKFGRGISSKTIELIMKNCPDILVFKPLEEIKLEIQKEEKEFRLLKIKGIGEVNAKSFVKNITTFIVFLYDCGFSYKLVDPNNQNNPNNKIIDESNPLYNKKIAMTKVRDKDIIQWLKETGSILQDSVNSETFILIVKSKGDTSSKILKAKEKGILIMTPEEFKEKYM